LVGVCFWRIVIGGRVLAGGDMFTYFYPYWAEATRALRSGRLPLWNPYLFAGVPFLANSQAGVLYPPNWPLWLSMPAHRSVHLSPVLHIGLAATGGYLWMRVGQGLGRVGSWTTGLTYALGGYLTAQLEHVNQVQGLAWLPFVLLLYDCSFIPSKSVTKRSALAFAALGIAIALALLAGHTQTGFTLLVGAGAYACVPAAARAWREKRARALLRPLVLLACVAALGIGLAGAQLLPTWQLSRLSIRAGGLPYKERVSFSLSPLYLARALLPGYGAAVPPAHLEHVAYVGIVGVVLVVLGIARPSAAKNRRMTEVAFVALGLFLSLGRFNPLYSILARSVPGFAHFRVPARWLVLYTIGAAALAGRGMQELWDSRVPLGLRHGAMASGVAVVVVAGAVVMVPIGEGEPVDRIAVALWCGTIALATGLIYARGLVGRSACAGLLVVLAAELWGAGSTLPHNRATAPQAFTDLRPSAAHLLVSQPGRFLGLSDITFDPGDLGEMEVAYGPQLESDAFYDLVIATKQQEVLSPNLPLALGIPALDGYDGGLLPLARYNALQELLSSAAPVSMDGRLRENLRGVPEGRWLRMLDTRYVLADKLRDAWIDDVFYDLQFGALLGTGAEAQVAHVPQFEATALGVVSWLEGASMLTDDTVVGEVRIDFADEAVSRFELAAGAQTAEGSPDAGVVHAQPPAGARVHAVGDGKISYASRLRWDGARTPVSVTVLATLPEGELRIRALSLIDERTGSFQSLVISDQARYRLVHSGDVKIYENLDVLTPAHLVRQAVWVNDDVGALAQMRTPGFDPASAVVLERQGAVRPLADSASTGQHCDTAPDRVVIEVEDPELLGLSVEACAPAYLVLSRTWYPGWQAWVDGKRVPILRADLLLSAIVLDRGTHSITYRFRPAIVVAGAAVSLLSAVCLACVPLLAPRWLGARRML
jgi:hypothetical protein